MNFKKNIGFVDQLLRALLILDLVVPCLLGLTTGVVACVMISLAVVLLVNCLMSYCWLYDTFNVTTL